MTRRQRRSLSRLHAHAAAHAPAYAGSLSPSLPLPLSPSVSSTGGAGGVARADSGSGTGTTFGGTNFVASGVSPARGYLQWSTLDPRREMPAAERLQLIRDSRALCANNGIAKVLGIIAGRVGVQRPQLASRDETWNAAAEAALHFEWRSSMISDRRGIWNAYNVQPALLELMLRDGEVFVILTKTDTGRAAFQIVEAHRCTGSPWGTAGWSDSLASGAEAEWFDGIRLNRDGRAISYWFTDPDRGAWAGNSGQIVPAANVIHLANRIGTGPHGVPALAHAIIDLKDIIETRGYTKAAMKIAAMLGLVITADKDETAAVRKNFAGTAQYAPDPDSTGAVPADAWATADPSSKRHTIDALFPSTSGAAGVAQLEGGMDAKVLADDRPSPNMMEFHAQLLESIATGLKLPGDFIRQAKLTGPGQRYAIRQVQERIDELRADVRDVFLNRYAGYCLAVADKNGYISGTQWTDESTGTVTTVTRPADWYALTWQTKADLTIDVGRDGNLELKQLEKGITTRSEIAGSAGANWDEVRRANLREAKKILQDAQTLADEFGISLADAAAQLGMVLAKPEVVAAAPADEADAAASAMPNPPV